MRLLRFSVLLVPILSARRTPDELDALVAKIEASSRAKLADMRLALADERDRREAFSPFSRQG
jgi:hypothetical protein